MATGDFRRPFFVAISPQALLSRLMNSELSVVLALLAIAVALFMAGRPRMDAVALIMLAALPLTGIISVEQALAGFSDPSVILIALLFVIGEGLARTGVALRLGDWLIGRASSSETRLVILLMLIVASIGSVMSSTGVVAIFLPIVMRIARRMGKSTSRLMMPLSVAALISGMMSLVATAPNLVVNGALARENIEGFGFFSITPFGIPLLILAIAYMTVARRWLGPATTIDSEEQCQPALGRWIETYGLAGREFRLAVSKGSSLIGNRLDQFDMRGSMGVNILALERRTRIGGQLIRPTAGTVLREGDVLFLDCQTSSFDVDAFAGIFRLEILPVTSAYFSDLNQDIGMAEVLVPPESKLIGQSVVAVRFRSQYDLSVIGLKRGTEAETSRVIHTPLAAGDTLLVAGPWTAIRRLQGRGRDLLLLALPAEFALVAPAARHASKAILALACTVALMVSGIVPNVMAALIGCLMMGLFKCIDLPSAYRSIHWQSLIVIVGMLPFSIALQQTGGTELASRGLVHAIGDLGPRSMLAAIFLVTAIMGLFISNTATAVLMAPIAISVATDLAVSPYPFAMTVALAASSAFMTPVSSPVNTLVTGPGNYSFLDFVKIGVPLTVIALLVTVLLVPIILPL